MSFLLVIDWCEIEYACGHIVSVPLPLQNLGRGESCRCSCVVGIAFLWIT